MRTIKGLPSAVPRDSDESKFPFHTIQNETDSQAGTPVVREIYGDLITNLYALLSDVGIEPNEIEDSEIAGYQLLEAFKKFANILNDVEQVLTLNGTVWSVNFDIDNLPDKYVFVARTTAEYNASVSYTFTGTDDNSYSLSSATGFNASDVVLVVIDQSGVRVIGLTKESTESDINTGFGTPLAFNDGAKMYYLEEGNVLSDAPSINNIQNTIRIAEGNGTLYVYDAFVIQGKLLCFCWISDVQTYKFYQFDLSDLDTAIAVNVSGISIPTGSNNEPYCYTDGNLVYITNQAGTTANENELAGLLYDPDAATLTLNISRVLHANFTKSTNAVIQGTDIITFIAGSLRKYDMVAASETNLGDYNSVLGVIFRFNGETYYSNGELAKKWTV
ncbi:hypothetical protein [Muricauda sp. MAR_2010_75]|uniref:hypothetical protein n=1 Tax=Allomuricauda sp. MAR_2010_75 TaxID=1250232 RepID=UPI00056D15B6|nr:hypothetical protein [Muricauda sp. MAR_2010_75]